MRISDAFLLGACIAVVLTLLGVFIGFGVSSAFSAPVTSPGRVELTGGLDQQPCANGFFFVATPVSHQTEILSITLNFGSGPQSVSFVLGPNKGQATVTDGAGRTIVSGFAVVAGATERSRFNLSHCAGTPTTPTPTPTPTVTPTVTPSPTFTPTPMTTIEPTTTPTATSTFRMPAALPRSGSGGFLGDGGINWFQVALGAGLLAAGAALAAYGVRRGR